MNSIKDGAGAPVAVDTVDLGAWRQLYDSTSPTVRQCVARIVREHATEMAGIFYNTFLADARAGRLLSHELVGHRLHASLQNWMRVLLASEDIDLAELATMQRKIGEVHARVGVTVPLVSRGARILKDNIAQHLRASELGREDLSWAQQYVGGMVDQALEVMNGAYLRDSRRGVRADEAYRLFSLGQNVTAERERQRAVLLEWAQSVLLRAHVHGRDFLLPALRSSEFGLWMRHKGSAMFEGTSELPPILDLMDNIDGSLLPALTQAVQAGDHEAVGNEVQVFQRKVDDIKFLLMTLFDRVAEIEGGRDPLTQVLNRRFLPTVLAREIAMANKGESSFAIFMADVDFFKSINDSYGHSGGDAILRQLADLLQQSCRAGDYVFRYGGEEFLVVLVDGDTESVGMVAEKLRAAVERHRFRLPDGNTLDVTISIGAAAFDGHPDPDMLVNRADKALYAAKAAGRNCWRLA